MRAKTSEFANHNPYGRAYLETLSASLSLVKLLALGLTTAKGSRMGIVDEIFGGSDTSVNSTVTIAGLDNMVFKLDPLSKMSLDQKMHLDPVEVKLDEKVHLDPVEVKLDEKVHLDPVEVKLDEKVHLDPVELKLDEDIHLDPVTLNENIDLKPVAVDTCQTLRLAPLPDTSVCNPYTHRIAFGVLGFEVATVAFTGETEQQIRSPQRSVRTNRTHLEKPHTTRQPRVVGQPRGISIRVVED